MTVAKTTEPKTHSGPSDDPGAEHDTSGVKDKVDKSDEDKAPTQKTPQENADAVFEAKDDFLYKDGSDAKSTTPEDLEAGVEYVLPSHSQQTVAVPSLRF